MKSRLQFIRNGTQHATTIASQRPVMTGFVAVCAVVLGVAGASKAITSPLPNGHAALSQAAAPQPADLDSLFDSRSPGSRGFGALVNTKQPRTGFDVGPPSERVLTSTRRHPGMPPALPGDTPPVVVDGGVGDGFGTVPPASDVGLLDNAVPAGIGGAFVSTGPGLGGVLPGPSGGGGLGSTPGNTGPGSGSTPTDIETPTPLPAVPEPMTWVMLVLGFFIIGASMRQRRSDLQLHGAR